MKHVAVALMLILAAMTTSCDKKDDKGFWLFGGGQETKDVVNDQKDTGEFSFQTVHDVSFDLLVLDENGSPLSNVLIRVSSDEGDITTAMTAGNGTSSFKITIAKSVDEISLVFEHPGCVARTVDIENIQELASVERSIYLELSGKDDVKEDRDGDGVPDDSDEFPDDPLLVGTVRGEYTIAYEDLWPKRGDADFNDLVVRLGITEYIDQNNMISKIVISSQVLAAGAGYKNQFWIGILGNDYQLIFNPKQDLSGKWNAREKDDFVVGPVHTEEIILDPPVAREAMDPMPYDPYIKCNGNDSHQVHLSFVKTKFKGTVLDEENFPWALLVPSDWAWPYEESTIFDAYPDFKPWYESKGAENGDWYLRPQVDKVFKAPGSPLSAYLLGASNNYHRGILLGVLALMILFVAVLGLRRRKGAGA